MDPVTLRSPEETEEWGARFGASLTPGDVVVLKGPLGAGKSVVCRGIARGLGFTGVTSSPTYSIVHEYESENGRTPPIYHIDLYRLPPGADADEIGLEHYLFSEGVTLIEWPERIDGGEWEISVEIEIEPVGENERRLTVRRLREKS